MSASIPAEPAARPWPLETRVPPPLLLFAVLFAMGGVATLPVAAGVGRAIRLESGGLLMVASAFFMLWSVLTMRRAHTTIDPVDVHHASTVVTTGPFRITRNPIYLGMLGVTTGWAIVLAHPVAWVGPVAFLAWLTRLQVVPEERAMRARFGDGYAQYAARVSRWL